MELPILFIDGDCTLCNCVARFVIKRNKNLNVQLLSSDTAKKIFKQNYSRILSLNTLVFLENNIAYFKSNAILQILGKMGGFWPVLGIVRFVPRRIRDKVYDIFAKHRKRFGMTESCSIEP